MSHSTEWDILQYKSQTETDEQWDLRRTFMERWKNDITEDRLVCLARVFLNIEFLGCRYPGPVMRQVAELSKEVAHEFRESKKKKIQRTFVSASDAAGDKARRTNKRHHDQVEVANKKIAFISSANDNRPNNETRDDRYKQNRFQKNRSNFKKTDNREGQFEQRNSSIKPSNNKRVNIYSKYGNLVLFDKNENMTNNYISKIHDSCQQSKVKIEWTFELINEKEEWNCYCKINEQHVAVAVGNSQKTAKDATAIESWKNLQKVCYTIVNIPRKDGEAISMKDVQDNNAKVIDPLDVKVESSVASRMMKLMGWKGGALGAFGTGISEPISINLKHITRAGIGAECSDKNIMKGLKEKITKYKMTDGTDYDLVFTNDFSKEERADMHKVSARLGLKSKSYGQDNDRYLVISKHTTPQQLVQNLSDNGGSNNKYKLVNPTGI